jgi:hypothetical protein
MRLTLLATLSLLAVLVLADNPRYLSDCENAKTKDQCDLLAEHSRKDKKTGKRVNAGDKGFACAWKGLIMKTCDLTETLVDLVKPDPSKLTKGSYGCKNEKDQVMCNSSFAPSTEKEAVLCFWLGKTCVMSQISVPYDQLTAAVIPPKPEGKKAVLSCGEGESIPCEQKLLSWGTTPKGKVCTGCAMKEFTSHQGKAKTAEKKCVYDGESLVTLCE